MNERCPRSTRLLLILLSSLDIPIDGFSVALAKTVDPWFTISLEALLRWLFSLPYPWDLLDASMPGMWNQDLESEVDEGEKVRLSRMLLVLCGLGPIAGDA